MSVKRTILQSIAIPELPGSELRLVLLEFPPGYKVPAHIHPFTGAGYLIQGKFLSQYEGQDEVEVYNAGDTFIEPANVLHHRVDNDSEDEWVRVILTYVAKKGEATTVMV